MAQSPPSRTQGTVGHAIHHDSAKLHVCGTAHYVDDMPTLVDCLHIAPGYAPIARGTINNINLDKVRNAPGVVCVLTQDDIPGTNDVSPTHSGDDPLLLGDYAHFHGQVLFAVCAHTHMQARQAARLAEYSCTAEDPIVTAEQALAEGSLLSPTHTQQRGDAVHMLKDSPNRLAGQLHIGGQDHFYLEGQVSSAQRDDDGNIIIYCSTQHPSEVQHVVAQMLDLPASAVRVIARRMGGAFGGKESQANQWAGFCALAAFKTGRATKCRLDRDDDMIMTGKRHDFIADYDIGFDDHGKIQAVDIAMHGRCGSSKDLSDAICDRAMFHADNVYFYPHAKISASRLRTNTVSNTAFRGFGGPQGMMVAEWVMERIARATGQDPLDVRRANLYCQGKADNVTPYFMPIEDFVMHEMLDQLERTGDYRTRREAVRAFNQTSPIIKRGLALTPVRFGISFTTTFLNQAGALVHIYKDGSILLNHGCTEMGQGLYKKVAQVAATAFDVPIDKVCISAADTAKIPNTSATAAS
ncbi:MAG: molybdopterin cofactor-binding domain-containing protein, partial [Pseudomonadota bacterium]